MNEDKTSDSEASISCQVVSKYFSTTLVMDRGQTEIIKKKSSESKKPNIKPDKVRKRSNKKEKGQKDIRTLIKKKNNELQTYAKDFGLVCKQSGIDVDPEQLQLAIALSKSLHDNISDGNFETNTERSLSCNQRRNKIRLTLKEYGFETKKSPTKKIKKYRKHYKLILESDSEKQQKIDKRYEQILLQNCTEINYKSLLNIQSTNSHLYNLTTNASYSFIRDDVIFYINNLVPRSLNTKHIFKDWSKIPGRPVSPKLERPDINFKNLQCSQEELDKILSGTIEEAHDIVKRLNIITLEEIKNTLFEETEDKQQNLAEKEFEGIQARIFFEDKTSESANLTNIPVDVISHKSSCNMTIPINRSHSPDLFDDEETVIMDSSKDIISMEEVISKKTVTIREQNDFMDLTECVGIINYNSTNSTQSQGQTQTQMNSNDIMDLTECVSACSQKQPNSISNSWSCVNTNEKDSLMKSRTDEKSLDDTIIMIDEEYNTMNCRKFLTLKETVFIDLVDDQNKSTITSNATIDHQNSTVVSTKGGRKDEVVNNDAKQSSTQSYSVLSQHNKDKENYTNTKISNQVSNFEGSDFTTNIVEVLHDDQENLPEPATKKSKNFESLDLSQSSNSEGSIRYEVSHNHNSYSYLEKEPNLIKDVDLLKNSSEQKKHCNKRETINKSIYNSKTSNKNVESTIRNEIILNIDSDREFDNLFENRKLSYELKDLSNRDNCKDNSDFQEFDLTQNSSNDIYCDEEILNNVLEKNNKQCINLQFHIDNEDFKEIQIENSHVLEDETITDVQNSDIDLTQQSDCSEDTIPNPAIIEIIDELGKRNNVSIDYDEMCDIANNERECEINLHETFDTNNFAESHSLSKEEGVCSSSQQSEVFELSDDELNYSVKQHKQDFSSITKQGKFDIGGISTIDDILSQKTLSKSKLRCSCSSNGEANNSLMNDGVENCFPVVTLTDHENLIGNSLNKESKSCEEVEIVKISTPLKSRSENNILLAKTPKNDDYVIKTNQVTPMPNYERMASPERNAELDKFGIKPLKRKRAIKILTHIYNQTHPLMEVVSETEEYSSPLKIRRSDDAKSFPARTIGSPMVTKSTEPSDPILEILESDLSQKSSRSRKTLPEKYSRSPEKKHVDSPSSSNKENALYEELILVPDIRNIECCPEDWVFQKREKAKVHSCRVPLHIAFHNYVSTRKSLREAILRYEPINIDDIHKGLVDVGYKYNPKDLLRFMDRKCITVKTADNSRKHKTT